MKILREEALHLLAKTRAAFGNKELTQELLEDFGVIDKNIENGLFSVLSEQYKGVTNGYLSELYESVTGEKIEVVGEVFELYVCPCCGYRTLSEQYDPEEGTGYDICAICDWEDDGTTATDVRSSVNRGTILEYRDHMRKEKNKYYRNKWLPG